MPRPDYKKISKKIKSIIKNDSYIRAMFREENICANEIDEALDIRFEKMDDRHAQANSKEIVLNSKLLADGEEDFFKNKFHYVIHELNHWINRRAEKKWYFNDLEEIQSFIVAISWEIYAGKNKDEIYNKIFPIIKGHFKKQDMAKSFFLCLYDKAKNYLDKS